MWVARNKDNSLFCFNSKPIRTDYNEVGWYGWVSNYEEYSTLQAGEAMMYCSYMRLNDSLFSELTWEDEPIEVKLERVFDKSNPTTFESYGNHLRNLLSPYQTLIDVVKMYMDGNITDSDLCNFLKDRNIQEGLNNILEFSKSEKLEDINWRENV